MKTKSDFCTTFTRTSVHGSRFTHCPAYYFHACLHGRIIDLRPKFSRTATWCICACEDKYKCKINLKILRTFLIHMVKFCDLLCIHSILKLVVKTVVFLSECVKIKYQLATPWCVSVKNLSRIHVIRFCNWKSWK